MEVELDVSDGLSDDNFMLSESTSRNDAMSAQSSDEPDSPESSNDSSDHDSDGFLKILSKIMFMATCECSSSSCALG